VEAFSADIGAYQHGFATSAEEAGLWTQIRLWIARNRVLSVSTAVLIVVVSAFMVKVVGEGKKATEALNRLQKTAPTFNSRARDALEDGHFAEALESIDFAVDLEPSNADFHGLRGNILQVLERWPDAVDAYRKSLQNAENEQVRENLELTERLLEQRRKGGELTARAALFEALNVQGRRYEAMEFGKQLGDFWKERKRGQKDLSALADLVKRLESKLLPVPGTRVLMSKSEFTVGEWKLYLRAEGLPEWQQPDSNLCPQTDEHPVVNVNWSDAKKMCAWLSEKTGKTWRLPTNAEWSGAVGNATYPWGEHFPPNRDDGNYQILANGTEDPRNIGTDGISGTAPVGSFKANALGFYDLGGNVWEWMWDATTDGNKRGFKSVRGGAWIHNKGLCRSEFAWDCDPVFRGFNTGFRIALVTANP
jgi:formylglycine-generating enzyme required for sulfatase activity